VPVRDREYPCVRTVSGQQGARPGGRHVASVHGRDDQADRVCDSRAALSTSGPQVTDQAADVLTYWLRFNSLPFTFEDVHLYFS
jgi:hypothetical protein